MAIYVSAAQRLRRTVVIAVITGLVALVVGWAVGRQQVPSIEGRVADVRERAAALATNVDRLEIEYEQVVTAGDAAASGTDSVEAAVIEPLDELRTELQQLMDDAPWLVGTQRSVMLDAIAEVRSTALAGAPLDTFVTAALAASGLVRSTFGVPT